MQQIEAVTTTHDSYKHEMHPEYTRIIRGRKHVAVYDETGQARWAPVTIVSKTEVDEQ